MFFRKPIFILALTMTAIITGAYVAQYYSWSVSYTVHPLTETITVTIQTSGSTIGTDVTIGSASVHVLKAGSLVFIVDLTDSEKSDLKDAFENLTIRVIVDSMSRDWEIVKEGTAYTFHDGSVSLPEGDYDVVIKADYWTKAVTDTASGSFPIRIYLIEA